MTRSIAVSPTASSDSVTDVPGGVWVREFARRLATTWCKPASSPATYSGSAGTSRFQRWSGPAAWASLTTSADNRARSTGSGPRGGLNQAGPAATDPPRDASCVRPRFHRLIARATSSASRRACAAPARCSRGSRPAASGAHDLRRPRMADSALAGLPCRQRGGDVIEHPVDRQTQPPHLGARVGVRFGDPEPEVRLRPDAAANRPLSPAVAATRFRARALDGLSTPRVVATPSAAAVTTAKISATRTRMRSTSLMLSPTTIVSSACRLWTVMTR